MIISNQPGFVKPEHSMLEDFITILTSADGKILTKQHKPGGIIVAYDSGYEFTSTTLPVKSIDDLAVALECAPQSCVILGKIRDGVDPQIPHRRLLHQSRDNTPPAYEPMAHTFGIVDIDGPESDGVAWLDNVEGAVRRVIAEWLPAELGEIDVAWRLTGSAGIKPGIRLRVAFMLDRPVTAVEMKAWFAGCPNVDHALFAAVQPIYGSPVFDGVPDPIEARSDFLQRSGVLRGRKRRATPPFDLGERLAATKTYGAGTAWQEGEPISLETIEEIFAVLPPPAEYKLIRDIAAATAAANVPDDPDTSERCGIFSDWAMSGSVPDHDGQDFCRVFHSLAKPGQITVRTLFHYAKEAGWKPPNPAGPPDYNIPEQWIVQAQTIERWKSRRP